MKSRNLQFVIGTIFSLLITTVHLSAQCNSNPFGLSQYTVISSQQNVTVTDELSGLTYNDVTDEFVSISDGGRIAERNPQGVWTSFGVSNYGSPHCDDSRFSDIEAITYIRSNGNSHQYAIADERDRALVFVDITSSQTSLSHPSTYLKFNGLPCGSNNGIEGAAFDQASGRMYFSTEQLDQKIYSFIVPTNVNGQTINVTEVVDLQNVNGLNTVSTHALDILPNGNIVAILTKPGAGNDSGLFPRMLVEITPCGDVIDQFDLETTIPNTAEIEGIAMKGNDIYLIGELGVFYQLSRPVPPSIQVTSPAASSSQEGGSMTSVRWASTNVAGNVEIQLFLNGNFVSTLANSTSNDGNQSITLPSIAMTTSGYSIRVVSKNDTSVFGESGSFTISAAGMITVTAPSSGSILTVGSATAVTWLALNITGNINLELYKGSSLVSTLASNINNDGVQSVVVPAAADGNDYRIRAVSANNGSVNDFSDFFTISNPGITVVNPSSGASYSSGESVDVQWSSIAISGSVKIELFKGSSLVTSLEASTVDDGTQQVTLPTVASTSNDYTIKVTSLVDPSISDSSGAFVITSQQVFQITNPTGGETISSQGFLNVQWNSTYGGTVSIELHKANAFVSVLTSSTNDDGSHLVQLPTVQSSSSDYSIKLINRNDNSIFDFSNPFTITQAETINVITPAINDTYFTGNPISVTWNSTVGGNVKIELYENGSLLNTFATSTPNDNSQIYTIPADLAGGNSCQIKISSLTNPNVIGSSDQFQIINPVAQSPDIDLVIQSAGAGVQSNNTYTVNGITVMNQGNTAISGTYTLGAYLSTDPNITFSDFRIGTVDTYTATGAGQSETSSFNFDTNTLNITEGNYYVGFIIDEFDDVSESDEMNNTAYNSTLVQVRDQVILPGNGNCHEIESGELAESFETDLGFWAQNSDDDIDWTRTNTRTPSSATGPGGAIDGSYFLYTEASNANRNKSAVLTSGCLDLANTTSPRMRFDFHMFGSTMGTLQVNVIDESGRSAVSFIKTGNQGDVWNAAVISLSSFIGQSIFIEIEATTGSSFRSDIAIDNITISDTQGCTLVGTPCDDDDGCTVGETYDIDCNCQGGVYTDLDQDGRCIGEDIDDTDPCLPFAGAACRNCSTTISDGLSDSFEGSLNNWTQSSSDDNQWLNKSGSTPSSRTGPAGASDGNTYMYVEASHGGFPFKVATMNSVCLDLSTLSTPMISFDYSMYGSAMGTLEISVVDMSDGSSTEIFSQSGNQGSDWISVQRDLSAFANKTVQIKIQGITGFGFRSDIAIDNIEISNTAGNLIADAAESRNFVEQASANIEEFDLENEMLVYPVPAADFLTVAYQTAIEIEQATLSLVNANGQVIITETLQLRNGMVEKKVDVSGLPTGTYYATIHSTSNKVSKKLLIIH